VKRKVYIETSVASYLTACPSRDLVVAAHQQLTLEWWANQRQRFHLYISELVLREASKGDPYAAERRMAELAGIPLLPISDAAVDLARSLVDRRIVPRAAVEDALHVALATSHGMDFLLTWNCRHIANAEVIGKLELECVRFGFLLPTLCTPEQLMGD
jgi:PIN domain